MAEIKTKPTAASVEDFINTVKDEQKRKDSFVILEMMKKASGEEPKMWGSSLIGFGNVRLKSPATGREVDWLRIGFSPRKANLSLYITGDIKKHAVALKKQGKHKTGVGCLYINKLEDIDIKVLKGMIEVSLKAGFFGKMRQFCSAQLSAPCYFDDHNFLAVIGPPAPQAAPAPLPRRFGGD